MSELELPSKRRWTLALVATSTMAISYLDRQALSVLAPEVTRSLGISEHEYGWLASAFSMAYLVGTPLGGRLIATLGARPGMLGAVLVWSAVAGLHALVPGFAALFALRIALGLAEAPAFPGAAGTVHRVLPPADRPRGTGILFTGSSFGAMVAPPLASLMLARFGWRAAFVGTALAGLCWVPLWLWATATPDARAALAPAGAAPAPTERVGALLGLPSVRRGLAAVLASAPTMAFALLWGSKFMVATFGLQTKQVGAYLWLPPVIYDLGSVLFGDLATRRARSGRPGPASELVAVAGLLVTAIAFAPLAPGPWAATLAMGVGVAGVGGLFAVCTADALAGAPPAAVPVVGGLLASAQSVAYVVVNPLIGRAVEAGGYPPVAQALALWVGPGVLYWLFLARRERRG